jgi:hypothetical protein
MKLTRIGNQNAYVLKVGNDEILFSYQTPVAFIDRSVYPARCRKSGEFHSVTTSKHVNRFFKDMGIENPISIPQVEVDVFVSSKPSVSSIVLPEIVALR